MTELEETWSPEPVIAWRYWYVGPLEWDFGEHRWKVQLTGDVEPWDSPLKLAGHHLAVQPGLALEVIDHEAPHAGCRCGINAVKALDFHELQHRSGQICMCYYQSMHVNVPNPRPIAVSQVELTGIVDEYEGGYRAQQATIIGPMIVIGGTSRVAEVLSENYGIEVRAEDYDGPLSIQLAKEYESGHREADTPDHRGTGTGQDTGASKRTRKDTLTYVLYALGIPAVWLSGATVMAQSDAWWSYAAWFVSCMIGGIGVSAFAHFLKRQ